MSRRPLASAIWLLRPAVEETTTMAHIGQPLVFLGSDNKSGQKNEKVERKVWRKTWTLWKKYEAKVGNKTNTKNNNNTKDNKVDGKIRRLIYMNILVQTVYLYTYSIFYLILLREKKSRCAIWWVAVSVFQNTARLPRKDSPTIRCLFPQKIVTSSQSETNEPPVRLQAKSAL